MQFLAGHLKSTSVQFEMPFSRNCRIRYPFCNFAVMNRLYDRQVYNLIKKRRAAYYECLGIFDMHPWPDQIAGEWRQDLSALKKCREKFWLIYKTTGKFSSIFPRPAMCSSNWKRRHLFIGKSSAYLPMSIVPLSSDERMYAELYKIRWQFKCTSWWADK